MAGINQLAAEWFPEQNRIVVVVAPEAPGRRRIRRSWPRSSPARRRSA